MAGSLRLLLRLPFCAARPTDISCVRFINGKPFPGIRKKKKNHYEVLRIKQKASTSEIRAAFVEISKQIHPDRNPHDPTNHDKFVELNEAYNVLRRPASRSEYDTSLAHRLYYEQTLMRQGYESHTAGESHRPGSGTATVQSFESEQQAYWDETIWHMRDKRYDRDFHQEDRYYGIKGIKRLPNSYIVYGCMGVMLLGTGIFYAALQYSSKKSKHYIDQMNKRNTEVYNRARHNASKYSTAQQLQKMFGTPSGDIEDQAQLVKNNKISPTQDKPE